MFKFILLAISLFVQFAWADVELSTSLNTEMQAFQTAEAERVQPEESKLDKHRYATHISIMKDDKGRAIRTKHVFVLIHGLFESPEHLRALHDFLFDQYKQNVVSLRLAGHFDKKIDMTKVKYMDWVKETREQVKLFSQVGDKLVFIGHSTGGLLASLMASENSAKTDALILAAAAFENSLKSKILTRIGGFIDYDTWDDETGRRIVASLGYEVEDLAEFVDQQLKLVPARIAPIRIMTEDTEIDGTVDPKGAERFFNQFPEGLKRSIYIIPASNKIEHKDVPKSKAFRRDLQTFLHVYFNYPLGPMDY